MITRNALTEKDFLRALDTHEQKRIKNNKTSMYKT